ncbi:MAG TPA: HD domain-containing phosphohydrolase [Gaiellaceae bacterium]|nr:HD domain-containing phosphohydrolase [Gaiellaceae bacterium]
MRQRSTSCSEGTRAEPVGRSTCGACASSRGARVSPSTPHGPWGSGGFPPSRHPSRHHPARSRAIAAACSAGPKPIRVGELALRVGIRGRLAADRLRALGLGALLHDLGKLLVPDEILRKPGALTDSEFDAIREHPVTGAELLAASPLLAGAADLVRWHHERPDGSGYPDGLSSGQIPLEAAIISACDGWDAMTYSRHYRAALEPAHARRILAEGAGTQWDSRAIALLEAELDENGPVETPLLDAVGRERSPAELGDVCLDALPARLRAPLAEHGAG